MDAALDQLRRNELLSDAFSPSDYYSLGAAYMWLGDYESALTHFDEQIRAGFPRNVPSDGTFGMAGAAAWCLGDEQSAIKYWRKGTSVRYAVAGANTRTELLLYASSLLNPAILALESAKQLLIKKAGHWRVKNWPGPIAQYILGQASEKDVRQKAVEGAGDPAAPNPKSWQFDFYKLLTTTASAGKDMHALESGLQTLITVNGSEYVAGLKFFYFLRIEEFYLARHFSTERSGQRLA